MSDVPSTTFGLLSQPTNVDFQYPKSDYCRLRECNDLVFVRNGILRESQVTSRSVELLNRSLNPVLLACLVAGCRTPPLLYLKHIFVVLLATGRTRVWVAFFTEE